jgi:hypothetical protein
MKSKEPIKDRFARDIRDHVMEIRHDDGLYRHVVFKRPDTVCMMFSICTMPGRLIYAGDMGCFVFERTQDMFEFFGHGGEREPNFGCWHEKLVAIDRSGSEEHDSDRFRENLEIYLTDELTADQREEVVEFIDNVVSEFDANNPHVAYQSVYEFSLDEHPKNRMQFFQDFFEHSDMIYTLRYEWACHAIQWGIRKYDEHKSVQERLAMPDEWIRAIGQAASAIRFSSNQNCTEAAKTELLRIASVLNDIECATVRKPSE